MSRDTLGNDKKTSKHLWISRLFCLGSRSGLQDAEQREDGSNPSYIDRKAIALAAGTSSISDTERREVGLKTLKHEIGINTSMSGKASSRALLGAPSNDDIEAAVAQVDIPPPLLHHLLSTSKTEHMPDLDSFGIPGHWWASTLQLKEEGSPDLGQWEDTPYPEISSNASVAQREKGEEDEVRVGAGAAQPTTLLDSIMRSVYLREAMNVNQELVPARDNLLSSGSEPQGETDSEPSYLKQHAPGSGPKPGSRHSYLSNWSLARGKYVISSNMKNDLQVARRKSPKASGRAVTAPAPSPPSSNGRRVDLREGLDGQVQDSHEALHVRSSMHVAEAAPNHHPSFGTNPFNSPNSPQILSTKTPTKPMIPSLALPLAKLLSNKQRSGIQHTQDPHTQDPCTSPSSGSNYSSENFSGTDSIEEYFSPPRPPRVLQATAKQPTLMGSLNNEQHNRRNPSRKHGVRWRGKNLEALEVGVRPTSARFGEKVAQGAAHGDDEESHSSLVEADLPRKGSSRTILIRRSPDSGTEEGSLSAVSQGKPHEPKTSRFFGLCQINNPEEAAGDEYACGFNPVSAPAEVFSHIGLWANYLTSTSSVDRTAVNELPENPPDMMPRDFYLTEKKSWNSRPRQLEV